MDTVVIAACIALFLASVVYSMMPLLNPKSCENLASHQNKQRWLALQERKEQLYASIKELEFDHSTGKLALTEFQLHRHNLEQEAVAVLGKLDESDIREESKNLTARIERDIAKFRLQHPEHKAGANGFCASCRTKVATDHRFCPYCGKRV